MNRLRLHSGFRILSGFLVFSVLALNVSAISHCSLMLQDEGCCHKEKTVKSCCVKNLKINVDRISGHCGCNMKETQQPSDLYSDLASSSNAKFHKVIEFFEIPFSDFDSQAQYNVVEYSPPESGGPNIYLTNLNLRI